MPVVLTLKPTSRVVSLDYVRGLAAFGILFYHFHSWTFGHMEADSFWGRIGLYGVAMFYVLSGLTLYHVYEEHLHPNASSIIDFYLKRVFRLFPLLWLIMPIYLFIDPSLREWDRILLNYTGLFGFVAWDRPIGIGVWSIGNELVFYLFFPLFLFAARYNRLAFATICAIIVAFALYFAFYKLNILLPLASQWHDYVNPLNQVFLFLGGVTIGYLTKYKKPSILHLALLLIIAVTVFIFYPAIGDTTTLVTTWNRIVFSITCLAICFAMYKLPLDLPAFVHAPLQLLGEVSYALYLLHPLVYKVVKYAAVKFQFPAWCTIAIASLLTILLSYLVYRNFEQHLIRLGRKVSKIVINKL